MERKNNEDERIKANDKTKASRMERKNNEDERIKANDKKRVN